MVTAPAHGGDGPVPAGELEELIEEAMAAALASCMVEELIAGPAAARPS